jgi:hypothetical protein
MIIKTLGLRQRPGVKWGKGRSRPKQLLILSGCGTFLLRRVLQQLTLCPVWQSFAGADSVLKTTPLFILGSMVHNPINVAFILVITAVLAVVPYAMREPRRRWFMLLILPQQCLLLMHFVSAAVAILNGQYHDGYVPNGGSAFIFADQVWLLMVVIVHTLEYIEAL